MNKDNLFLLGVVLALIMDNFKCPACVCILNGDRLAVSDWGNDRIQIFNSDGDHLLSIGQRGKTFSRIFSSIRFSI